MEVWGFCVVTVDKNVRSMGGIVIVEVIKMFYSVMEKYILI